MFEVYEIKSDDNPVKFLVRGVHGREWKTVSPILRELAEEKREAFGKLVVIPRVCKGKRHVSTLDERYYETTCGKRLLRMLKTYEPDVYVEVHCYRRSVYEKLTSAKRLERLKVPQMVDFGERVLLGHASQHLLSKTRLKLAIVLEVPCGKAEKSKAKALEILGLIKSCRSGADLLARLSEDYHEQTRKAIEFIEQWLVGKNRLL